MTPRTADLPDQPPSWKASLSTTYDLDVSPPFFPHLGPPFTTRLSNLLVCGILLPASSSSFYYGLLSPQLDVLSLITRSR